MAEETYSSMRIYAPKWAIDELRGEQSNTNFWAEIARMKISGKIEAPKA